MPAVGTPTASCSGAPEHDVDRLRRVEVADAKARSATSIIVVDPRRPGLRSRRTPGMLVRPGSGRGCAGAWCLAAPALARRLRRRPSMRDWTNGPLLVREDDQTAPSRPSEHRRGTRAQSRVRMQPRATPMSYDSSRAIYDGGTPALDGRYERRARTVEPMRMHAPFRAPRCRRRIRRNGSREITWVPAMQLRAAARLIAEAGAISCYTWSGVGQHTNASQSLVAPSRSCTPDRQLRCAGRQRAGHHPGHPPAAKVPTAAVGSCGLM